MSDDVPFFDADVVVAAACIQVVAELARLDLCQFVPITCPPSNEYISKPVNSLTRTNQVTVKDNVVLIEFNRETMSTKGITYTTICVHLGVDEIAKTSGIYTTKRNLGRITKQQAGQTDLANQQT